MNDGNWQAMEPGATSGWPGAEDAWWEEEDPGYDLEHDFSRCAPAA